MVLLIYGFIELCSVSTTKTGLPMAPPLGELSRKA